MSPLRCAGHSAEIGADAGRSCLIDIGAILGLGICDAGDAAGPVARASSPCRRTDCCRSGLQHSSAFRTPWISTMAVGVIVAIMPGFLPIDQLAKLVNIGTLLAFTIVCAGVWVLRVRHPDMHRPFKHTVCARGSNSGHHLGGVPDDTLSADHAWKVMIGWLLSRVDYLLLLFAGSTARCSKCRRSRPVVRGLNCVAIVKSRTASCKGGRFTRCGFV